MDTFEHFLYRQSEKKSYVEDMNNCAKDKDLTVFTNGGQKIFDRKGRLTFLPLGVHVNNNYLATIISLKYVNNISGVLMTMDTLI